MHVLLALAVASLAITAVGALFVWLFSWEDVFGVWLEALPLDENVGLLTQNTSVEKSAVGRLIWLAGSWSVVWWNPLQTSHALGKIVCGACCSKNVRDCT